MELIKMLRQNSEWLESTAYRFSQKWKIPVEEYRKSMQICVENARAISQWYIVTDRRQRLIAGAGVIENDFHDRKDLFPECLRIVCRTALSRTGNCKETF